MPHLTEFGSSLDGELPGPGSPGHDAIRRPVNPAYRETRPRLVVRCRSVADVAGALVYARSTGLRLAVRGGGHCFAGRSSSDGIVLDMSGLDDVSVDDDRIATIGAGARLEQVYTALHAHGRTLPAGCGATVGITGLTLGGGIGLLGRRYGLTCDRLIGARVVLADGTVVDCDHDHEPDLFWALRGAGGGQFGVVTSLRFDTAPEPRATRVEAHWSNIGFAERIAARQSWAPDAPDGLTADLTLISEPGAPGRAALFGASILGEESTRDLLREFTDSAEAAAAIELPPELPFHRVKESFADLEPRNRSERAVGSGLSSSPSRCPPHHGIAPGPVRRTHGRELLPAHVHRHGRRLQPGHRDATAFAHRGERFLLEHVADATDPWVDRSWETARPDGSGRVYPNFPDPAIENWTTAYHVGDHARLAAVKAAYDPHRHFDFPQAI